MKRLKAKSVITILNKGVLWLKEGFKGFFVGDVFDLGNSF